LINASAPTNAHKQKRLQKFKKRIENKEPHQNQKAYPCPARSKNKTQTVLILQTIHNQRQKK